MIDTKIKELAGRAMPGMRVTSLFRSRCLTYAVFFFPILMYLLAVPAAGNEFPAPDGALLARVFPGATRVGAFTGKPAAAPAFRDGKVVGYIFHSRAVIASAGFSGKPLDVLIGIDLQARITGAALVEHQEPILVIGVADADLQRYVDQYRGRDLRNPIRVERRQAADSESVHAVTGATISSVVINDAILRSARVVARSRGLLGKASSLDFDTYESATWTALVADGSLVNMRISAGEAEARLAQRQASYFAAGAAPSDPNAAFLDLFAGLATLARVGRNLVGAREFNNLMAGMRPGDQLLFVAGSGLYSFKGTAYVREGAFDRIQVVQGDRTITLRKADYRPIEKLRIQDAPDLRETALFVVPGETGFDPAADWRLEVAVRAERANGGTASVVFPLAYSVPGKYRRAGTNSVPPPQEERLWLPVWQSRIVDVIVLALALAALWALLFFQDALVRQRRLYNGLRIAFLAFTLLWIGWYAGAQLSVFNVLTFAGAVRTGFRWDFFLLEPLIFVLWGFVAITLLFWGRGVFCGWLCPFGALQELLNSAAQRLGLRQISIPFPLHERLWPLKYILFIILFGLSLGTLPYTQSLVEVEPFKTAIVLRFDRAWPFVAYVGLLLVATLFVQRFFCRYVCPLGGALAFPARMRMFEWLKRRWQCGLQCQVCANNCPVQAIHPDGRINPNECIHCLNCQVNYYDDTTCPPLVERRKRRPPKLTERLIKRFADAEQAGENNGQTEGDAP